ncbi:hypothetical protein KXD40_002192 [Peronospora effusa]|uniref:Ubiquitin-like domain-containing protein n=1 Tax=Peronospora effusa TaxID=542832 RepID=A0A3R7W8H9_9STRA|nr:hypothetical protein DD237_004098 [Peronospora effusa]UIZ26540.1 hypothetical protein KXD40_002192 [Peronospora effusa]CAI5720561.1 unnamed protein product [Peronospora effusa]
MNTSLEPVVEPLATDEDAHLSLKVRTLDQKTYSITICAAASVPELKELVAVETGITLARQRLIYRGRVLKNDQTLASYSLEDGHVLHLVVRAVPPPPLADAASTDDHRPAITLDAEQNAGSTVRDPSPHLYSASHLDALNEVDALNAQLDEFQRTTFRSRARSRQLQDRTHSPRSPPSTRDNDEPDPTMGRSGAVQPGRVLMGATIAVPEGTGVTMPFLSSLVSNLITQVRETGGGMEAEGATTGTTADGQHHVTFLREVPGGTTAAEMDAATARATRAFRHPHRYRDDSGSQRAARRSSSGVERQAALRARIGLRLEAVRATLDDASLEFPTQLSALPQGDNTAMSELQQQVEMLLTLLERFGPRLRLLPAALSQRDHLSGRVATASVGTTTVSTYHPSAIVSNGSSGASAEANTPLIGPSTASVDSSTVSTGPSSAASGSNNLAAELVTASIGPNTTPAESGSGSTTTSDNAVAAGATLSGRQIICIIEALQTIGESTELLARVARHAFVRQSIQLSEPISRRGNAATAGDRMQARFHARARPANSARVDTTAEDRTQATLDAMQATRTSRTVAPGVSNMRPRVSRISTTESLNERSSATPRTARASSAGLPGSTLSFPADLTSAVPPPVPGPVTSVRNSQPITEANAARSDGDASLPTSGAHISISNLGLPLVPSVVFPFSLAADLGGSHATTTWNLADFISRLTSAIPISTLYGVMAGNGTHLHHILAQIGFALFSGVDVPRVTRPSIHTWTRDLVAELRRLMRLQALPADVTDQVNGTVERRLALADELLRVVEPFIPNLVDILVRATSASRAAAFGTSSATFLRTMTQQVVRELRSYARGDSSELESESDERFKRLLQGLLVWLGMNDHMASFVVDSLLCWIEGDSTVSRRGHTHQRDEASSDAGVADSPATKRKRE